MLDQVSWYHCAGVCLYGDSLASLLVQTGVVLIVFSLIFTAMYLSIWIRK